MGGTLVTVYGVLMPPLGWELAGIVWLYSIVWMLVLDGVKVGVRRMLRDVVDWGEMQSTVQPSQASTAKE